jgi:hypothetical protein
MKGVTLYGWRPDLKKIWPELEEIFAPRAAAPAATAEPVKVFTGPGHPKDYDWAKIEQRTRAIKWQFPAMSYLKVFGKIQGEFAARDETPPAISTFYAYFKRHPL